MTSILLFEYTKKLNEVLMQSREYKEETLAEITNAITGFRTATKFHITELIHKFRSVSAEQNYQSFYALCDRIMPCREGATHYLYSEYSELFIPNDRAQMFMHSDELYPLRNLIQEIIKNTSDIDETGHTLREDILLGLAYQFGWGVDKDIAKAAKCFLHVKAKTELEEKNNSSDEDRIMRGIALGQLGTRILIWNSFDLI